MELVQKLGQVSWGRKEWIRQLTHELLQRVAPNSPLEVQGPDSLEATFFEQRAQNRVVVHILNTSVAHFGYVEPISNTKIRLRRDFLRPKRIYTDWPEQEELTGENKGEYLEIPVPETNIPQNCGAEVAPTRSAPSSRAVPTRILDFETSSAL